MGSFSFGHDVYLDFKSTDPSSFLQSLDPLAAAELVTSNLSNFLQLRSKKL
jgi:hypothetical protein